MSSVIDGVAKHVSRSRIRGSRQVRPSVWLSKARSFLGR